MPRKKLWCAIICEISGPRSSFDHRCVRLVTEILFLDVIWQFGGLQFFDLFWGFLDLGAKLGSEGYVFRGKWS